MLILVNSLRQLRFGELMQVYTDSVEKAAAAMQDIPWGLACQRAEQDLHQYLKDVFFRTPGAMYAIWEEKGRYVSALRLEPYRDGLLLSALETAPSHREKGYAEALIREALRVCGSGKVYSHVGKTNAASLHTHCSCGFRTILDYAVYLDGSVDRRCYTMVYER